ncbi:MAG TPA: hypothetical protein VH643_04225 [Gemmataceae bacterium]|jgi:WD40 repeat protein
MFFSPVAPRSLDAPSPVWKDWHRATFLGAHIEKQRCVVDDVLAVEVLHTRIRNVLKDRYEKQSAEVLQALHLEHFFRGESKVYSPLPLIARDNASGRAAGVPDRADDLSALLVQLESKRSKFGVVLRTRAGAGKTVAARKAFHDCLLWGFLPCWMSFDYEDIEEIQQGKKDYEQAKNSDEQTDVIESLADKIITSDVVLKILARACRQPPPKIDLVRAWLEAGPKLLLFADLNAIPEPPTRAITVKALANFQKSYGSFGHRCVISCRDTPAQAQEEKIFKSGSFQTYDLSPISPGQVKEYLKSIEKFVEDSYGRLSAQLGLSLDQLQVPAYEPAKRKKELLDLMKWQDRRGRGGHLLCTPLFMHLISQLPPKTEVHTLAQLYRHVIQGRLGETKSLPKKEITALTRAALMMQARPEAGIGESLLQEAWQKPDGNDKAPFWWPKKHESYNWCMAPYYQDSIGYVTQKKVFSYGLLREGDTVAETSPTWGDVNLRFIHDSFIDYFVGAWALGRADGPNQDIQPTVKPGWFPAAAERLHKRPAAWRDSAFFLGGVLTEEEVQRLLACMAPLEPVKDWPAVAAYLLHGGPRKVKSECLKELRAAVRRTAAHHWPEALFSLCYHALRESDPESELFKNETKRLMNRPWLQLVGLAGTPLRPSQDSDTVVHLHHGPVEELGLSADGTRVVALSRGIVRCWDRETGEVFDLAKGWHVTALAMLPGDDRVALGCADGRVALALPAENEHPDILYRTDSAVTALAVRPGQTELVASHANGKILSVAFEGRGRQAAVRPRNLRGPRMRIRHLWALPDRTVVAGGDDGTIAWMGPNGAIDSVRHAWAIVQLVALESGVALFADVTGTVYQLQRGMAEAKVVERSPRPIRGLGTTADGVVVYVDAAGVRRRIELNLPRGRAERSGRLAWAKDREVVVGDEVGTVQVLPQPSERATSAAVPVLAVGGSEKLSFACAGEEVRIVAAADDVESRRVVCRHFHSHPITCLLARPEQKRVVTGTDHGEVAIWDADADADGRLLRGIQTVRGAVTALDTFDPETDTFLCGDSDGAVVLVSPRNGRHLICQLKSPVTCVRTLDKSLALVGCGDGKVYRVRPKSTSRAEPIPAAGGAVIGIAGRPNTCWIVGHRDGALQALDGDGANPRPLKGVNPLCCLVAGQAKDRPRFVAGDCNGKLWFGGEGGFDLAPKRTHDHFGAVTYLDANPEGTLVVSAGVDRMVLLWDIRDRCLLDAYEAGDIVTAAAWLSADCLAVGLGNGNVAFLRLCRGGVQAAEPAPSPLSS